MSTTASQISTGYKRSEVGIIPDDWEVKQVTDVCGFIVPGRNKPRLFDGDIPWVTTPDLTDGGSVSESRSGLCVSKAEAISVGSKVVPKGSVLMSCVGELGIVAYVEHNMVINQQLHAFIPTDAIDGHFLMFALKTRMDYISSIATKTAVPYLNKDNCNSIQIPFPRLTEQEAIAEALGDADALIESLEQLIAKKRHLKQSAMQQLLTGKIRLPGFEGEWRTQPIGKLFSISGGLSASRDQLSHDGICYLHYGDIHGSTKNFIDVEREYQAIPKLDVALNKVSPSLLLEDGDIVFVDASEDLDGTNRHVVIANPSNIPFISGLHTIVAKPKTDDLEPLYCRYCFETRNVKQQFRFFAVGTKVSGVSKTNIAKIKVAFPSPTEQLAIAVVLIDIDNEITAIEAKLAKARQIKRGMMQELLTGRTRLV